MFSQMFRLKMLKVKSQRYFLMNCVRRLSFLFGKISTSMMFLGSTIKKLQIKTSNPTGDFLIHFPFEVKSRVLWGQK